MKKKLILVVSFVVTTIGLSAQFTDSLKTQLLRDWKRSKAYTQEYLNAMPADKYSYKPQDSIRSFAQQMIHMAQGTVNIMATATGAKVPAVIARQNLENTASVLSKDSVTYMVNLSYDFAIEALESFDMLKSVEAVKRGRFNVTRLGWMLKAYEHQAHHRGQTTIYIRTVGIKPPNEKLFD
jgi:uncharacterized damage-inducible protein DinB